MRWLLAVVSFVAALLLAGTMPAITQGTELRIVSASPTGEVGQLSDADEVRVVFSEPMVALGAVPPVSAPSWLRMTPAVPGSFYWSGTKTLIFSPDASKPLPNATKFTVRVDAAARSASGRVLGSPYEFTFTTPTVRLLAAEWYRKTGRFDGPAVIALRFNQAVRPRDAVAHAKVVMTPHDWEAPVMSTGARLRLTQTDPAGLSRFDEKVEAARRVASSTDPLTVRVADSWDEQRFPRDPARVVLETTTAPSTNAWLTVTLDASLPGAEGPETHAEQSSILRLEPTFFVNRVTCAIACDPATFNPVVFTRPVALGTFSRMLRVADADGSVEREIARARDVAEVVAQRSTPAHRLEDAGFDSQLPATTRRLELDSNLEATDGQTLGYPWVALIQNAHALPVVTFGGEVWEASGGPELPVNVRNVLSVTQWLAPTSISALMPQLLPLQAPLPQTQARPRPPVEGSTRRLTLAPDVSGAYALDIRSVLSSGGTGLVWAAAEPADVLPDSAISPRSAVTSNRSAVVQVTNLGITVKDSPQSTLMFVTRLDTGAPVPDARVAIVSAANETMWRGTTDRDGLALAPGLTLRQPNRPADLSFIVTAEKDGDVAFVGSNWGNEVHPINWRLNYQPNEANTVLRGGIFTDRGVYRETDEVHLKAVLRDDTASGIQMLPDGRGIDVLVRDGRGREIDRRTVNVNRWSSAEWTWRVPAGAALGTYRIEMSRPGTATPQTPLSRIYGSFLVAAYRRPDFRVDATLEGDPPVLGSTLRGAVQARYLFGGALGDRPVRWFFRRSVVQNPPEAVRKRYADAQYAIGYMPSPQELGPPNIPLPQKTERLGADGRLAVDLPTSAQGDFAYSYTFEGDVEGLSGQHIANRSSVVVHPASFYVAMSRPPMFVDSKAGTNVAIVVADLGGESVAGVPVTVSLFKESWSTRIRPENPGITFLERREVPAGEWTVRSGTGEVRLPIPLTEGGCYILRSIARDSAGRQTRTDLSFYATGSGATSWRGEGNRIELTPERKTWKPGERARILIQSPWDQATALLTLEREGIRSHRRFTVTSRQDIVEVPITEADIPNVFVSVVLVKRRTSTQLAADGSDSGKPGYRVGYTELAVEDASKRLRVDVSSDRDEYRPGQSANLSVAVAAPDGRPVSGEVAFWAMDYGLLSLTNYKTPDVLKQIYVSKAVQVLTQDNRQRLISRPERLVTPDRMNAAVPVDAAGAGRGGGVGGGVFQTETEFALTGTLATSIADVQNARQGQVSFNSPSQDQDVEIRSDFRPVVFWLGSVITDPEGRATTTVKMPDSLTSYRVMAVAGDQASQFGFGEREIRVAKPLTMLPTFPRFLTKGDRASFGAVVTNSGKESGDASVTIQSFDPNTLQFSSLTQRVRLAPGASASVKFDGLARAAGNARVRMTATLGAETDAFEMPLGVTAPMVPETTAAYGETTTTSTERLALPAGILPGAGGLSVELASTALVGLGESARYVTDYQYQCAEQVTSRALALMLASDLGGAFQLQGIEPAEYRAQAEGALRALAMYQCPNGGYALWSGQCTTQSAYLTAYALHAMNVAGTLKYAVNRDSVNSALNYLQQQLRLPPPEVQWWPVWAASQAYSVKVLAEFGRNPVADITRLAGLSERLPVFALSYLADALAATNDRGPRYEDVVRRLSNALRVQADRAHVEEVDDAALAWLWNTNVRATAVVLDGFARRKDDATFVAPLVRWLVAARTNGRWKTTHENAMALEALVAYYRVFEGDVPQMTTSVKLGSTAVGTAAFKGRSTTAQQVQMSMADLLKHVTSATSPTLSISREGTGRVYYTARVQTFSPEPPQAVDRGFRVDRRYERYVSNGPSPATTAFGPGDLVRITVGVTLRGEGRYLALTDPLPAGFEPIDNLLQTTASDLARQATRTTGTNDWLAWWRRGTFDHVEKHDDRVVAFATRLGSGRHEFSYLVRATTAGTFGAAGARVEAMYAPELTGRSTAATVQIR